jgi:hypothetical protein
VEVVSKVVIQFRRFRGKPRRCKSEIRYSYHTESKALEMYNLSSRAEVLYGGIFA